MIIWTPLYNSIAPGKRMTREIAGNNNHLMHKATTCEADMTHEIMARNIKRDNKTTFEKIGSV
jgi:hypothetical protein